MLSSKTLLINIPQGLLIVQLVEHTSCTQYLNRCTKGTKSRSLMQLLHDCALTSDWLISALLKKRQIKKKGRRGRDDRRKKQPFVSGLRQGLEGKTLASSHQGLKQKQLINTARQIRSPCALNTSPSRGLPLFQSPNTSAVSLCCH